MEGKLSLGMPVDLDQFGRIAGHERRVLESLGLERKARVVDDGALDTRSLFSSPAPIPAGSRCKFAPCSQTKSPHTSYHMNGALNARNINACS
jgi:hypothetical protein